MAVISGQFSKVVIGASSVMECQQWQWTRSATLHAYASCNTNGYKKRVAGTKDHSGSFSGLFDPENPPEDTFDEGDAVTLLLYVNATDYYSVPALIETLELETNNDEGEPIPWTANFGGNGAWSSSGL